MCIFPLEKDVVVVVVVVVVKAFKSKLKTELKSFVFLVLGQFTMKTIHTIYEGRTGVFS